jgi:hypothetical protein
LIGELRNQKTLVLGLHVSFMDTDMTKGYEMKKIHPRQVAEAGLTGIGAKRSLSNEQPMYLNPPEFA